MLAQHALNIFETINARPPGVWATSGLLILYVGALMMSAVGGTLLVISRDGNLGGFMRAAANQPRHSVECDNALVWQGSSTQDKAPRNMIVTTFEKTALARRSFEELKNRFPANSTATLFGDSILLSVPSHDDSLREQWFDELQKRSTNTFVSLSNSSVTLTLTFIAPTALAATNLQQELEDYFASASTMNLIPPWDPDAASTEFEKHRKARASWRDITKSANSYWSHTNLSGYSTKIAAAQRRGAMDEVNRLTKEQEQRGLELQSQARSELKKKYASTPFASLVDLEQELSAIPYTNRTERTAVLTKVAAHLGAREGAEPATVGFGMVARNGLLLEAPWLGVKNPDQNLPQLLGWLCRNDCAQIKYAMQNFGGYSGDDLDEP